MNGCRGGKRARASGEELAGTLRAPPRAPDEGEAMLGCDQLVKKILAARAGKPVSMDAGATLANQAEGRLVSAARPGRPSPARRARPLRAEADEPAGAPWQKRRDHAR